MGLAMLKIKTNAKSKADFTSTAKQVKAVNQTVQMLNSLAPNDSSDLHEYLALDATLPLHVAKRQRQRISEKWKGATTADRIMLVRLDIHQREMNVDRRLIESIGLSARKRGNDQLASDIARQVEALPEKTIKDAVRYTAQQRQANRVYSRKNKS